MINPNYFKDEKSVLAVEENLTKRNTSLDFNIRELVIKRKQCIVSLEDKQQQRNTLSKKIGEMIAAKESAEAIQKIKDEVSNISEDLKNLKIQADTIELEYENACLLIPNIIDESVPVGKDEHDNKVIHQYGEIPKFSFEVLPHFEIASKLNLIDFDRSIKLSGARFYIYNGKIANLERKLINLMLDTHTVSGYEEKVVPLLVKNECMLGTGQFPKFKEEYYTIESDGLNLIPTAEVPLTNIYADEILSEEQLPIYMMAATSCFRREAGSAGKDTRGIIRVHQFQKVELVKFCTPENSEKELESLTLNAESILQKLGLTYRRIILCSGDIGFTSSKTYDLEIWMPGAKRWLEISSCSNFKDFQARRAKIRYKNKDTGKNEFVHTLNGSGVAAGRLIAALLEYYQTEDGNINWDSIYQKISI